MGWGGIQRGWNTKMIRRKGLDPKKKRFREDRTQKRTGDTPLNEPGCI